MAASHLLVRAELYSLLYTVLMSPPRIAQARPSSASFNMLTSVASFVGFDKQLGIYH